MLFGEKVKQLRQERDWTQPDLAERLGIEQSWLSKIENNKSVPSSDLLNSIAEAFELPLDELLQELDPLYVRNTLASLPEVRGMLQEKKFQIVNDARNWLLVAAVSLALGIAMAFAGDMRVINEEFYVYQSEGLVYPGEPQNLFEERRNILSDIARARVGGQTQAAKTQYDRMLGEVRSEKELELGSRREFIEIVSATFEGTFYIEEDSILSDTTDIYGNSVAGGSTGTRLFTYVDTQIIPSSVNRLITIVGIFFVILGLGLFVIEWRMSRIRSKFGS